MFSNDHNIETIAQLVDTVKHYIKLQTEYARLDIYYPCFVPDFQKTMD